MKKIYLLFLIFVIGLIGINHYKPILIKYITGTSRILSNEVNYKIYVNKTEYNKCKVFEVKKSFDKTWNSDILVLFFENSQNQETKNVLLIDLKNKIVGCPNSNSANYDLIFGNLFQSDSGSFYVPFDGKVKGYGFNTELKINNDTIDFKLPKWSEDNIESVRLIKN